MSGFDKMILIEKLIKLGWTKAPDENGRYLLIPPETLWKNKPETFYVYEARDLQELLGTPLPEDEE